MKIGDEVRVTDIGRFYNKNIKVGDIGRIVAVKDIGGFTTIGVQFHRNIHGHSCDGFGKQNHCSWIRRKYLENIGSGVIV